MLDRAHVENKMRAALARDGQPGSDIQPLIDRCDWSSLATTLKKDQLLVTDLLSEVEDSQKKVQRGIKRIQKKYFRELHGPSSFVISKCASKKTLQLARVSTAGLTLAPVAPAPAPPPPPYADIDPKKLHFRSTLEETSQHNVSATGQTMMITNSAQCVRRSLAFLNELSKKMLMRLSEFVCRGSRGYCTL